MTQSFFDRPPAPPGVPGNEEKIDKKGPLPAYVQLANILKQRISAGTYATGSRLPSEAALAKSFGLSAMTARQAVGVLVEEGLLKRVQGSGTFVQRVSVGSSSFGLDALRDAFMDKHAIDVHILKATVESASGAAARALGVAEGQRLVVVERLISHQQEPFTIQVGYARFDPEFPIVETMLDVNTITGLFFENDPSCFMKGELRLLPICFNQREANLLKQEAGANGFKLEHLFYDFNDMPASYGWFTVSPEKMPLISKVGVWNE